MIPSDTPRVLRLKEVTHVTGLSRSSVYRLMAHGFPAPIKIGLSAVGWLKDDIDLWITERKLASEAIH